MRQAPTATDPLLRCVPALLKPVAERLGVSVALKMADALGGRRLYIPRRPRRGQPLVEAGGMDAARIMADCWGGERFEMPTELTLKAAVRRVAMLRDDRPHGEVALALGLSYSNVKKTRRAARRRSEPDGTQPASGFAAARAG